jgi:tetratricopeptide (TPR) repeat protein
VVSAVAPSLDAIRSSYESGQYHTAYLQLRSSGLPGALRQADPGAALLAARILGQAGARRRARKIILETWRRHRTDPEACFFAGFEIADGDPLAALDFIDSVPAGVYEGWRAEEQADWLSVRSLWLARTRDFAAAERAWTSARELHASPWIWCVKGMIEAARDRSEAALAATAEARALAPWSRVAVELEAQQLCQLRRSEEARDLLIEATGRLESISLQLSLFVRHREAGAIDEAFEVLERAVRYAPEMERPLHDGFASSFAYLHYLRGDVARSIALRRLCADEHELRRADRLEQTREGARKVLPVRQVPQHHNTCAPATLTSLVEYWGESADHLEIAEEICHDGTPAASERRWATERGFAVRELTVTWDAAVALIDAGMPFALTTVFTTSAHAQAVVGYDTRARNLLVRDPSAPMLVEYEWDRFIEEQRAFGPRGMVLVPQARAEDLAALELPDAELWDRHYAVENALQRHDRVAAGAAYDALVTLAPDHFLRHLARRSLASYDGDDRGVLQWAEAMLAASPGDPRLLLAQLGCGAGLIGRAARHELAEALLRDHADDPAVLAASAAFLAEDGGVSPRAASLARRAVGLGAMFAPAYRVLADRCWFAGQRARATRLYRVASCLADGDENAAWSYFVAASITGEVDSACVHLEDRLARMTGRSSAPARTLGDAYALAGRSADAVATIERARQLHPDDGSLRLALAERYRLVGDIDAAARELAAAEGRCHEREWHRAAALLAAQRGDRERAIELWRRIADKAPLDLETQREYVAQLESSGRADLARDHLVRLFEQFPQHLGIGRLLHDFLQPRDEPAALRQLELLVERHPSSGWVLSSLAAASVTTGDLGRARELLGWARAAGHETAVLEHLAAIIEKVDGRRPMARAHYRAAITADADTGAAIAGLLALSGSAFEARHDLDFVAGELARQGSHGPGIRAFATCALDWLDPRDALGRIRDLRAHREHVWLAWAAETAALLHLGELDQALEVVASAVARFDRAAGPWRELASVHERRGAHAEQIAALERARTLEPGWIDTVRSLAVAYGKSGDLTRARALFDQAIAAEPLDGTNHGLLAELLRAAGEHDEALDHLRRAVRLSPEYPWAWDRLFDWSKDAAAVVELAREVVREAPAAARPAMAVAEHASDVSLDERLAMLWSVQARTPGGTEIPEVAAVLLARAQRWDEALAACKPAFWGESPPVTLRGRSAWVRHLRGEHLAAMRDMAAAIASVPSYEWGISCLVEWGHAAGEYIIAAEKAVAAAPSSSLAHAHLGEAHRELRDLAKAERSFRRALELDRRCVLACLGMFDVHFGRGEYAEAAPYLDGMPRDNCFVIARRVQLDAVSNRREDADARLTELIRRADADPVTITEAIAGYRKAGLVDHLDALLAREIGAEDAPESVGRAWWHSVAPMGLPWIWRKVRAFPTASPAAAWCAMAYVEELGQRTPIAGFARFVAWNYRWLRSRVETWATVGTMLSEHYPRLSRWWMRDWEFRIGLRPWMAYGLARATALVGGVARAWEICRFALGLPPDRTTAHHRLLLAPGDALHEESVARATLDDGVRSDDPEEDRFLIGLTEAVIAYRNSDRPARGDLFVAEVRRLVANISGVKRLKMCRQILRHVFRALAREPGSAIGWRRRIALELAALR